MTNGPAALKALVLPYIKAHRGLSQLWNGLFQANRTFKNVVPLSRPKHCYPKNQEAEQLRFCNSKRAITYKNRSCINLHQEWVNFIRKHSDGVTWTWARSWMKSGRNWISVMGSVDKWWSVASWCFEWKKYHCLELWSINSRFSKHAGFIYENLWTLDSIEVKNVLKWKLCYYLGFWTFKTADWREGVKGKIERQLWRSANSICWF